MKNKLKQLIIKAVPEILDLKFGCEVTTNLGKLKFVYDEGLRHDGGKHFDLQWGFLCLYDELDERLVDPSETRRKSLKIIGRPIQLADVLRAIKHYEDKLTQDEFADYDYHDMAMELLGGWNLEKDLDGQSDEFYKWCYNLLK